MKKNKNNAPHYFWGDQCEAWTLQQSKNVIIKEELMPPKTSEMLHKHERTEQFFYILEGTATFLINGNEQKVGAFEGITIDPETVHKIANDTESQLRFLVISSPGNSDDRITV